MVVRKIQKKSKTKKKKKVTKKKSITRKKKKIVIKRKKTISKKVSLKKKISPKKSLDKQNKTDDVEKKEQEGIFKKSQQRNVIDIYKNITIVKKEVLPSINTVGNSDDDDLSMGGGADHNEGKEIMYGESSETSEEYNMDDEFADGVEGDYEYGWEHNDAFDKPDTISEESPYEDEDAAYIKGPNSDKEKNDSGQ